MSTRILLVDDDPNVLAAYLRTVRKLYDDDIATGGQAARSARIENYLGFPSGISGAELADRANLQVAKFGATLFAPSTAQELTSDGGELEVRFEDGSAQVVVTS